jgi:hypothetical protein
MRRISIAVLGMVMLGALSIPAFAQKNPRGTSQITLKGKTVSVEYGRPALNGRSTEELLGQVKPGDVWRLGADTSTTFKTDVALAFGGATVSAGEYSLWMQKQDDNSWKLVFNKQHGQWGVKSSRHPDSGHDPSQDLVSVPLKQSPSGNPRDQVTITLTKAGPVAEIIIEWGTLKAAASFKAK